VNALDPTIEKLQGYAQGFFWILPNLGIAVIVFGVFLAGSWAARRAVHRLFHQRRREDLGELLGGFARWSLILFGLLVVATIVFPSISPANLLSTLGIGSIAIGFAFKDILQNWVSGLLILYREPFRRGDQIVSGGFEGTVEHVEARATILRTYDGQRVVIPNSDIYTRAVTVRTAFPVRRSEYEVGIGYGDDVETACRVMLEAIRPLDGVRPEPAPDALPWALDASTVNIKLRWWTASERASVVAVQGRVIQAVKKALTEAGIDIAFPTRVVLFHDQTESTDGDRRRQREGWPAGSNPPEPRPLSTVVLERAETDKELSSAK
jgi:small-conductance mechanosensitive channel